MQGQGFRVLYPGMTLTGAIRAAGLTDFSKRSGIRIYHKDGSDEVYDYRSILRQTVQDPLLEPDDCIIVRAKIF